jgi:hypothetical protein
VFTSQSLLYCFYICALVGSHKVKVEDMDTVE